MRLRNIKGSVDFVRDCPYVVGEPERYKGRWGELFDNDCPIHLEIGMGKGRFIRTLAAQSPKVNFLGMEKSSGALYRALLGIDWDDWKNLFYLRLNADELCQVFGEGEVAALYLNFSDPWPKKRHAKRRLTSREHLAHYRNILSKGSSLTFKTDNEGLFAFSVDEFKAEGWRILELNEDLHRDGNPNGNVMTEYELKFVGMGQPIYRLVASP